MVSFTEIKHDQICIDCITKYRLCPEKILLNVYTPFTTCVKCGTKTMCYNYNLQLALCNKPRRR